MTGQDLLDRLEAFTGDDDIDETLVEAWIDECQKDVAGDLGPVIRFTVPSDIVGGVGFALPSDFASLAFILVSGKMYDNRKLSKMKITEDNYIIFCEDIDISVTPVIIAYHAIPVDYTDVTAQLTVHRLFQPIILDFLIAMYYDKDGEGDSEENTIATKFLNRYEGKKAVIIAKNKIKGVSDAEETQDAMYKKSRYHSSPLAEEEEDTW